MKWTHKRMLAYAVALILALAAPITVVGQETGDFVPIFNGENLDGWTGAQYLVEDNMLVCPKEGGGTILTEQEYANFILRFEFKLAPGSNNGVAIRRGIEIQILDNSAERYANLQPYQYHGSIYGIVPAEKGALEPVGEWNVQEILADGPHIKVTLNDQVIVDADLCDYATPEVVEKRPGIKSTRGRIGFKGHGSRIEFRNIEINELPDWNAPPEGFVGLYNGQDLTGWKGLVGNPKTRAEMPPDQLAVEQAKADEAMRAHWQSIAGVLLFDGKGQSLCTVKDYGDFEMLVDWKIKPSGDSGIYLRGSPQVQIWQRDEGSGGLFNNQNNPKNPLVNADNPVGEWNTFRIKMIGEKVTIHLNDQLVVDNVTLENYWERDKPIYDTGQIELQNHGNTLYFRNVYIREMAREGGAAEG